MAEMPVLSELNAVVLKIEVAAGDRVREGDTLIVEYTNFSTDEGQGKEHLTARYKLLDNNHLLFGFTRDDPGTRMKPYSVEFVMWRLTDQEQLVEYACHEGNVGLEFTLSAARAKEREDAAEEQGK